MESSARLPAPGFNRIKPTVSLRQPVGIKLSDETTRSVITLVLRECYRQLAGSQQLEPSQSFSMKLSCHNLCTNSLDSAKNGSAIGPQRP